MQTKCPFFSALAGVVAIAVICLAILIISFCQFADLAPTIYDQHFDNKSKAALLFNHSLVNYSTLSFFFNGFFQGPDDLLEQKHLQHEHSLLGRGPPVSLMCSCHNCHPCYRSGYAAKDIEGLNLTA